MATKTNANPMKDAVETTETEVDAVETVEANETDADQSEDDTNDDAEQLIAALEQLDELTDALKLANDELAEQRDLVLELTEQRDALSKDLKGAKANTPAPAAKGKQPAIKKDLIERLISFHIPVRGALGTKPKVMAQWNELCADFIKLKK